jgi:hypothetical protein
VYVYVYVPVYVPVYVFVFVFAECPSLSCICAFSLGSVAASSTPSPLPLAQTGLEFAAYGPAMASFLSTSSSTKTRAAVTAAKEEKVQQAKEQAEADKRLHAEWRIIRERRGKVW